MIAAAVKSTNGVKVVELMSAHAGDLEQADHGEGRGVLDHPDAHPADVRVRDLRRLWQHHLTKTRSRAHPERETGLPLALRDRLEPGAIDLCDERAVEQRRAITAAWKTVKLNPKTRDQPK